MCVVAEIAGVGPALESGPLLVNLAHHFHPCITHHAGCHAAARLTLNFVEGTLMHTTYSATADTGLTCHASCRGRVVYLDATYGRRHTCSPPCAYACQDFAVRRMARVDWLG